MKFGFNARFLLNPFTGIGQYTRNLIPAMARIRPQDEFYLFTPELADLSLPDNCKQVRVAEKPYRSASLRKAYWEHILVPKEMERFGVQLAHFLYPSNPLRRLSMPAIVTVHDVIPWVLPEYRKKFRSRIYHRAARMALGKADHLITVSAFSRGEMVHRLHLKEKNISVIPLSAPEPDKILVFPDLDLRRKYFLYVGGYDERKNVPQLIRAFQKHIAPFYPIDLVLVGGKHKGLEPLVTDEYCDRVAGKYPLKLKGRVVFTGPLEPYELLGLYRQALAFAHPSLYEGFNLPLVEAMSAGRPLIVSDIPVHHEVTGGHALFVDPSRADSIGIAMHQLVHDARLRQELSAQSKLRSADFSWQKTAEETLEVYDLFGGIAD